MTVFGARARRLGCAGSAAPRAVLSVLSGTTLSGMVLSALALAAGPASAAPTLAVLVGPVAVGQPPLTARQVARNPFLPLTGPGASPPAGQQAEPLLRRGDTGDDVRRLQQALARPAGGAVDLVVDGVFGPRTAAAVVAVQSAHGLVTDGLVGQRTWDALASGGGR